ncbi:MAG: hypothetical protein Q9177_003556 [Variospora cf. flavescens]
MDLLQHLEEFATSATRIEEEPTSNDLLRWHRLFGYSAPDALDVIAEIRNNIHGRKLSDEQWDLLKVGKEAEGYDRETYEHQLHLWSTKSSARLRPSHLMRSRDTATYIFQLGRPFKDIEALQRAVGVSAELRRGQGEEGETTDFVCVDSAAKLAIEDWLMTQSPPLIHRPTFIRLSLASKDLSDTSSHPTLGIESSLPQHRAHEASHSFAPTQMEYPVWYFFYGTLMDPHTLQGCISTADLPVMTSATITGGTLRTWGRKYKALVDGPPTGEVDGYAYRVESSEQEEYLRFRETDVYEVVRCRLALRGGGEGGHQEEVQGLTFRFKCQDMLDVD